MSGISLLDRLCHRHHQATEPPTQPEPEEVPSQPIPETPEMLPEQASADGFVFPRTPAVEHAFRSFARNPSRYVDLLHRIHSAPAEARGEMAGEWMREHFPEAWEEVREMHTRLRHSLPRRLQSEEKMLSVVAEQWGESLYAWADHLQRSSPAYRRAVERLQTPEMH